MSFWQFFWQGRDGRALLVRPSRIPGWISKILFVLGSYEYLKRLEVKVRKYLFFYVKIFYNNSVSGEWNLWTFPLPGFNIILVRWFRCWRHFAHAISFTASPRAALYFCNTGRPCHARAQIVKKIDKVFRNVLIWHNTRNERQIYRNSYIEVDSYSLSKCFLFV